MDSTGQVTHTVLATPQILAAIGGGDDIAAAAAASDDETAAATTAMAEVQLKIPPYTAISSFRHIMQQLLMFFANTYKRVFRFEHPPLHVSVRLLTCVYGVPLRDVHGGAFVRQRI